MANESPFDGTTPVLWDIGALKIYETESTLSLLHRKISFTPFFPGVNSLKGQSASQKLVIFPNRPADSPRGFKDLVVVF